MNHILGGQKNEQGAIDTWLIVSVIFIITTIGLGIGMGVALVNYNDQKNNVDTKIATAVSAAVKTQSDADSAKFEAADKLPDRTFSGPEDFGSLSFLYPKTWSTYINKDASTGTFEAYLNPVAVPTIDDSTQYALRVTIATEDYDTVLNTYQSLVKEGQLTSSTIKIDGTDSTRLDGNFTKDIRGSAVLFKIRDKTVTIRTDADTFDTDFNALVASIKFNS
jgi:hypothetical protein